MECLKTSRFYSGDEEYFSPDFDKAYEYLATTPKLNNMMGLFEDASVILTKFKHDTSRNEFSRMYFPTICRMICVVHDRAAFLVVSLEEKPEGSLTPDVPSSVESRMMEEIKRILEKFEIANHDIPKDDAGSSTSLGWDNALLMRYCKQRRRIGGLTNESECKRILYDSVLSMIVVLWSFSGNENDFFGHIQPLMSALDSFNKVLVRSLDKNGKCHSLSVRVAPRLFDQYMQVLPSALSPEYTSFYTASLSLVKKVESINEAVDHELVNCISLQ